MEPRPSSFSVRAADFAAIPYEPVGWDPQKYKHRSPRSPVVPPPGDAQASPRPSVSSSSSSLPEFNPRLHRTPSICRGNPGSVMRALDLQGFAERCKQQQQQQQEEQEETEADGARAKRRASIAVAIATVTEEGEGRGRVVDCRYRYAKGDRVTNQTA